MDTEILENLGLTKSEIKIYLALLELGSCPAGRVLAKSGLQNSVVHRALNSLIEKGLVSYILEGSKKIYQAADPENFHDFIEDKARQFDKILPELKKKQGLAEQDTFAKIFKGKRGIKQMYLTLLNSKGKEYNTFGGGSKVTYEVMGEAWWKSLHTNRIAKRIPSRQVFDETIKEFGTNLNKRPLTSIRFLPKTYAQLQETIIIGDFVGIAIFTENPYGVLIKDNAVAEGYRKQFEMLWNKAKQINEGKK